MAITTVKNSLAQQLNIPLPGSITTYLQQLGFGSWMRAMPTWLRRINPSTQAANPYKVAGQGAQLPDDAKAAVPALRVFAYAGTGTVGELTVDPLATNNANFAGAGTGPAAGHVGLSPSGDLVFNVADAWTSVDVIYQPDKYDVAEYSGLAPVTAVLTLPTVATAQGVVNLLEAEILTGTAVGKCAILPFSASAPTVTLQAVINPARTQVLFRVADAPTSVRVKLSLVSAIDQNALMEAVASVI